MLHARPPAVAGMFYPARSFELREQVDNMLGAVAFDPAEPVPKALVVPHAGYVYSGPVAASAYARLRANAAAIRRVVLLGPAHRAHVRGLALPHANAFDTPLGRVPLDTVTMAKLPLQTSEAAHAREHSLEVQLPFLMRVLPRFELIPLAVGEASGEEVARVIESLYGGPETLIVVSSDLSHYLPYAAARATDTGTARQLIALEPSIEHEQACGATPINGLLRVALRHGLRPALLDLRSSGDTAGGRDEVVGYGSFGFYEVKGHDA